MPERERKTRRILAWWETSLAVKMSENISFRPGFESRVTSFVIFIAKIRIMTKMWEVLPKEPIMAIERFLRERGYRMSKHKRELFDIL